MQAGVNGSLVSGAWSWAQGAPMGARSALPLPPRSGGRHWGGGPCPPHTDPTGTSVPIRSPLSGESLKPPHGATRGKWRPVLPGGSLAPSLTRKSQKPLSIVPGQGQNLGTSQQAQSCPQTVEGANSRRMWVGPAAVLSPGKLGSWCADGCGPLTGGCEGEGKSLSWGSGNPN